MKFDYAQDIQIDKTALDLEWLHQPSLMLKYAKHSAKMQEAMEESKQNLDIARAEADRTIRENPEGFDIVGRTTEGAISSAILTYKPFIDASQAYKSAKYEADMAKAAVNAFEHRKSALEALVKLFGLQYFSVPNAPFDITREWEKKERTKKVNKKVTNGLNRLNRKK